MAAADRVASGMVVGLGTGSTAAHAIVEIGTRLADGRLSDVLGVPTSEATARLAERHSITLVDPGPEHAITIAIDGADQIAPDMSLIKGGGGAMLRERIVASLAETFVVVADHTKLVDVLGSVFAVPLEVVGFGVAATMRAARGPGAPQPAHRRRPALRHRQRQSRGRPRHRADRRCRRPRRAAQRGARRARHRVVRRTVGARHRADPSPALSRKSATVRRVRWRSRSAPRDRSPAAGSRRTTVAPAPTGLRVEQQSPPRRPLP